MMKIETKEIKLIKLPDTLKIHVAENKMSWQEAMDYAESIGMRLPSLIELQVIGESTEEFNKIGWVWSASTRFYSSMIAWYVYINGGLTTTTGKSNSGSVLGVLP
jgi:hypothetical protein